MTTRLLKAREVAEMLGLKLTRICELTRTRRMPFVLLGERQYRYSEAAIQRWIDGGGSRNDEGAEVAE